MHHARQAVRPHRDRYDHADQRHPGHHRAVAPLQPRHEENQARRPVPRTTAVPRSGTTTATIKTRVRDERIIEPSLARDVLRYEMIELLELATRNRRVKILQRGVPFVIMVVGVNGVGKTTTIAKLAAYHQRFGRTVMLAAGDTFRAAAIDQVENLGRPHRRAGDRARAGRRSRRRRVRRDASCPRSQCRRADR